MPQFRGRQLLFATTAIALACMAAPAAAAAPTHRFNLPAQPLADALRAVGSAAGRNVIFEPGSVRGKKAPALKGSHSAEDALEQVLRGSGLRLRSTDRGSFLITAQAASVEPAGQRPAAEPPAASANAPDEGAGNGVEERAAASNILAVGRQAPSKVDNDETIVVTGTLIRGIAPESSPTQVYTQEDIQKSGVSTVEEFVDRLPQNFGGGSSAEVVSLANDRTAGFNLAGGSGVNLRGLGSGSTLVLLNGRRMAPSGNIGDFVDVSIIPVSALSRVEVMTDGASAIYGADAIGGVINFRLRDDFDGIETFARYGTATDGGLDEYRAGATFGTAWGSGNALLSYDYFSRDNLRAEDRSFSSAIAVPNDLLPEQKRHSVIASFSQQLGDSVELRGHGIYGRRDTFRSTTFPPPVRTVTNDSESDQLGLSMTAEWALGGGWSAEFSGDYFKVEESYERIGLGSTSTKNDSELWTVETLLNGHLFDLPGGVVRAALGASLRQEDFTSFNLLANRTGTSDERSVKAIFGEVLVPLVGEQNSVPGIRRLELSLAGRYEDYSRFGDTFNPKIGAIWAPADGLKLRGSYGTSFNAPNLGDLGDTFSAASIVVVNDPQSPTGRSIVLNDVRSNPGLQPEEATTWSAGVDVEQALGGGTISASATYYDVDYDGRIAAPAGSLGSNVANPAFASLVTRDPSLSLVNAILTDARAGAGVFNLTGGRWQVAGDEDVVFDSRLRNQAADKTKGFDIRLAYQTKLSGGTLGASVDANHILSYKRRVTASSPTIDIADTIFNPADFRVRGGLSWMAERLSASLFVNHVGGYTDNRSTPLASVDAWTTVDLSLGYNIGEREGASIVENTRFALSVLNLFDSEPPAIGVDPSSGIFGYDPTNASPLGRFVAVQISKRW